MRDKLVRVEGRIKVVCRIKPNVDNSELTNFELRCSNHDLMVTDTILIKGNKQKTRMRYEDVIDQGRAASKRPKTYRFAKVIHPAESQEALYEGMHK